MTGPVPAAAGESQPPGLEVPGPPLKYCSEGLSLAGGRNILDGVYGSFLHFWENRAFCHKCYR